MREHISSSEVWKDDPDLEFDHTVVVWKEDDKYYQFRHPSRQRAIVLENIPKPPTPIDMTLFRASWDPSLTEAPAPLPANSFLKSPPIYVPGDHYGSASINDEPEEKDSSLYPKPRDYLLHEAKIYEILKNHPHPNICSYHGCVKDGDFIAALCLKKYGRSLDRAVWDGDTTLDPAMILDDVARGLRFLHETLRLAHNDVNASNVLLDDSGRAVITDFDACLPIGQDIGRGKVGQFGWMITPRPTVSLPENDLHALPLLAQFMKEKRLP